jgi:hypothetical protein
VPRPVIPVLAGLLLGVLFVASNLWALHDPQPRVRVAIASPAPDVIEDRLLEYLRDADVEFRRVESPRDLVRRREADYGYAYRESYYAGANGTVVNQVLPINDDTQDIAPLADGDPNGTALQYIVLGTILGGFLTGVLMAQLALGAPLWQRGFAYSFFAAAFGLLVAVVTGALQVLPDGSFLSAWVWSGATAMTIAVVVGALARLVGQLGIPLAMLAFLILGNPSSGASVPTGFQPWLFRTVGPFLPPNAFASGLSGTTYFAANVLRPVLVLGGWLLLAAGLLAVLDRSRGSRRALAYDAAGAADDREDRAV